MKWGFYGFLLFNPKLPEFFIWAIKNFCYNFRSWLRRLQMWRWTQFNNQIFFFQPNPIQTGVATVDFFPPACRFGKVLHQIFTCIYIFTRYKIEAYFQIKGKEASLAALHLSSEERMVYIVLWHHLVCVCFICVCAFASRCHFQSRYVISFLQFYIYSRK